MATWPSTKATTTHLSDGTDDPNQARPQISQNIDNVNSIIDFIVPTSLADGDILQYNDSTARFENKTLAASGLSKTVYLSLLTNAGQGSVNHYRFTELSDPYGIATLGASDGKLRLETGTYTVEASLMVDAGNYDSNPFFTGHTTYVAITRKSTLGASIGTSGENYMIPMQKFVVSSATQDYYIQFDSSSTSDPFSNPTDVVFKITKIS
jgi:hypothetical protein